MPHATVNDAGLRLYYEQEGDGEPLLCIMGLGADTLSWAFQRAAFHAAHRTVVFDNRDVGRSDQASADYTTQDMARDALGLADALGLETFHLLGISLGGAIAQHVALLAPERVSTLTLAVTWVGSGAIGRLRGQLWAVEAERLDPEEFVDLLMLHTFSEEFFEDADRHQWLRGALLATPNPQAPQAFARQARASRDHDLRGRLGELPMPAHVIVADRDAMIPPWKQRQLVEELPAATEVTTIEGGAHGITLERAEEFNAAVLGFTARSRAAS
jgi:pimeloyl-ACP methyl ester carboxylesterase